MESKTASSYPARNEILVYLSLGQKLTCNSQSRILEATEMSNEISQFN